MSMADGGDSASIKDSNGSAKINIYRYQRQLTRNTTQKNLDPLTPMFRTPKRSFKSPLIR